MLGWRYYLLILRSKTCQHHHRVLGLFGPGWTDGGRLQVSCRNNEDHIVASCDAIQTIRRHRIRKTRRALTYGKAEIENSHTVISLRNLHLFIQDVEEFLDIAVVRSSQLTARKKIEVKEFAPGWFNRIADCWIEAARRGEKTGDEAAMHLIAVTLRDQASIPRFPFVEWSAIAHAAINDRHCRVVNTICWFRYGYRPEICAHVERRSFKNWWKFDRSYQPLLRQKRQQFRMTARSQIPLGVTHVRGQRCLGHFGGAAIRQEWEINEATPLVRDQPNGKRKAWLSVLDRRR